MAGDRSEGQAQLPSRATDALGNVDGSAASDDWMVKKKRKR